MAERKRLLAGDWRLHASEAGDLLVQLGSGLHGMPFTEMKDFFLNLRPASRELRAVEVLSVGPMKAPTVLKGTVDLTEDGWVAFEYTGMLDKAGWPTMQNEPGKTRRVSAQALFAGDRALVLRVKASDERQGGFAILSREDDLEATLLSTTGEKIAVLPPGR